MSIRTCSYFECENYILDNVPSGSFTLFKFPKSEERYQQWMELGRVPKNIGDGRSLYMCSAHFDRKYMSINQRRTILLSMAIPRGVPANDEDDKQQMNDDELREEETIEEIFEYDSTADQAVQMLNESEHEEYDTSSMISVEREVNEAEVSEEEYQHGEQPQRKSNMSVVRPDGKSNCEVLEEFVSSISRGCERAGRKRSAFITDSSVSPISSKKLPYRPAVMNGKKIPNQSVEKRTITASKDLVADNRGRLESTDVTSDEADLIDTTQVTQFIFKSEEYVQMPKDFYLREKLEMMRKIKQYESTLKAIRRQVNAVGLN